MARKVVAVERLSKKYCSDLKRSLYYGLLDIGSELVGSRRAEIRLREREFWALDDVSFSVDKGELVGLIGPNGSGKTTLLKLLCGLIKPDRGRITIRGKIQALIALGAGFNPVLTGRENIYVNGAILGFSKKEMDSLLDSIIAFAELEGFLDSPVQSYSSGMQVRLGFAVAVNLRPDILVVDEVLAVGDAYFKRKARKKMMELLHSGVSVIFVSHNIALISSLTSKCIYLRNGEVVEIGPSDQVTNRYLNDSLNQDHEQAELGSQNLMLNADHTTPHLTLDRVAVFSADGLESASFSTGDDLIFEFLIRLDRVGFSLSTALCIRDQLDDATVAFDKMPGSIAADHGHIAIRCRVRSTFLREGSYSLGFFVSDTVLGPLFKSSRAASFRIVRDAAAQEKFGSASGYVVVDSDWSVDS